MDFSSSPSVFHKKSLIGKRLQLQRKSNPNIKADMDLFSNVKFLLIVGKFIFLIPCDGLLWKSHEDFDFRWNSFPSVLSFLIIVWCIAKDIVGFKFLMQISHGGVVGYVHPAHYFLISSIITIM